VAGGWRRLHDGELRNLCILQIKDEMSGACSTHSRDEKCYKILVGNPPGKSPPGRPRRCWENNIRIDIREMEWESVDWTHLAQDRDQWKPLLYTVINLRVP
jgi:hypothetical protein